ncbi:MAG TPA: hypothetical protein VKU39_22430 [Streptosporangiaceae bacterium]|nr:hypothetical protein [Streptosporangiaceae bacterium]
MIAHQRTTAGGVDRAVQLGIVDEIIEQAAARRRLAEAIFAASGRRGRHGTSRSENENGELGQITTARYEKWGLE